MSKIFEVSVLLVRKSRVRRARQWRVDMVVQMSSKRPKSKQSAQNGAVNKKALLVAQEISFAKVLAGNDKKLRDRGVKRLRKWLTSRSRSENEFKDDDYSRIWKGLFYCVWMADKPVIQEELCETISSLISCFYEEAQAFKFMKAFFLTMASEWNGIDQHRINKFLMLVRRFFRQCLAYCDGNGWGENYVEGLDTLLKLTYFPDNTVEAKPLVPGGLVLHLTDIFLEEIAKVSKGNLPEHALLALMKRFVLHIAICPDRYISEAICNNIFDRLIEQSPEGIEYTEKFAAWKKLGFPGDSLHCMERVDEGSEEEDEDDEELAHLESNTEPLDPRAGKVDVYLPTITFDASNVEEMIKSCQFKKFTTTVSRNMLGRLARKFGRLAKGNYPLGYYRVPKVPDDDFEEMTEEATESLRELQEQLLKESFVPKKGDKDQDNNTSLDVEGLEDREKDVSYSSEKVESLQNGFQRNKKHVRNKESKSNLNSSDSKKCARMGNSGTNLKSPTSQNKKAKKTQEGEEVIQNPTLEVGINDGETHEEEAKPKKASALKDKIGRSSTGDNSITATSKRVKNGANEKLSIKKRRLSLEPSAVTNNKFVVSELPSKDMELLVPSKILKPRRASLPAKLVSEKPDYTVISESETSMVNSKSRKLKRKEDSWDEPLQDGETEIVITRDMMKAKRKSLNSANIALQSANKVDVEHKTPVHSPLHSVTSNTPGSNSKKVNFVLQKNRAQGTSEYFKTLRENPDIPYDAKKKPLHGVLKASPYSSPINPFYLQKLKKRQDS